MTEAWIHAAKNIKKIPKSGFDLSVSSLDLFIVKKYIPPKAPSVNRRENLSILSLRKMKARIMQNKGFRSKINVLLAMDTRDNPHMTTKFTQIDHRTLRRMRALALFSNLIILI